jgi:transforming growth factor-beta-induced protein
MHRRLWFVAALSAVFLAACGGSDDHEPAPTIAATATDAGLTALVAAADKAGLVPTLSAAETNVTVFAPTDEAFTALATTLGFASAAEMVQALDAATLGKILTYHVVDGRVSAADLAAAGATSTQPTLYSFEGAPATLSIDTAAGVKLTDAVLTQATVTTADVPASNGVVHVIDKVLVPPGVLNLVQMAKLNPGFSSLVGAVAAQGLAPALEGAGPLTVFAPTDAAFAAIASTVASLTSDQLTTVLTYHVLDSQVLASDIPFGTPVPTLATQTITITAGGAGGAMASIADTTATPAGIVAVDIRASNGVIHVIDKVLIPSL